MKRWIIPFTSLSAIAAAVAIALLVVGAFDGGDGAASPEAAGGVDVAGVCAPDHPNCEDTLIAPDGAGDADEGNSVAPVCAPGFPDCADTIVADGEGQEPEEGDAGTSISPVCAPGFPDCVDMIVASHDDEPGDIDN